MYRLGLGLENSCKKAQRNAFQACIIFARASFRSSSVFGSGSKRSRALLMSWSGSKG